MKKKLFFKFFVFALVGALAILPSCKDYDDDISNLESQLSSLKGTVDQIDAAVKAGSVISNVASTANGIKITLSNGQSYDITNGANGADGTNGTNGANGADGSVVTIGGNGNWFIDGKDTELPARGPQGETGAPGADGKDGKYYYPHEDGFWYEVEGETETKTEMTWLPAGTLTATFVDGVVTLYNVEGHEGPLSFGAISLKNLIIIPDYVEWINDPVVLFSGLDTECGFITAPSLIRYRVAPTNASESMIDKENIKFMFNAPILLSRSAGDPFNSKAEFVSLKDGVLTVKAYIEIDEDALDEFYNEDRIPQLQLIVPTTLGDDIISDWITIAPYSLESYFLANNQFKEETDLWQDFEFPDNLVDAKALGVDHNAVVHIKYDQTFDLIDIVETIFEDWNDELDILNTDDYGLTYKFDLKDDDGDIKYITVDNPTDQQDFINLIDGDKGTVKSKVYTAEDSRTAIGRTPIVRVQLMSGDCVVRTGFIKINWVEDIVAPITVEISDTYIYSCGAGYLESNVEWMNLNIYDKLGMTKAEFHNAYYLDDNVYQVDELTAIPGDEVTEIKDTESGQTTYLFNWKHIVESHSETTTARIVYRDKDTDRIVVEVLATLTVEPAEFKLYGLNNTYWKENGSLFTVNPLVYLGDEAGDEVNIHADLLNGFLDKDGNYTGNELEIINDLDDILTSLDSKVYFLFDETKLGDYKYFIDGTEYSVAEGNLELSPNHTQLLLGGKVAANIKTVGFTSGYRIYLDSDGTNATPEAKALIGQRVPVKLVVDQCGRLDIEGPTINSVAPAVNLEVLGVYTIKEFEVFFIEPIKINSAIAGSFEDAVIDGSRIGVDEGLTFTDWRNYIVREEGFGEDPTEKQKWASELFVYYDIQTAVWDITNATSNLKLVGGNRVPTEGYTEGPVSSLNYQIKHDGVNNELVFFNNSGSALVESFMIYVPVTVGHKWGTLKATVAIEVNPAEEVN